MGFGSWRTRMALRSRIQGRQGLALFLLELQLLHFCVFHDFCVFHNFYVFHNNYEHGQSHRFLRICS